MTELGDDAAEKPLDPATERLRRKLVRLLALSVSTLFIGVMAVLGAIVYKLNRDAPPPATPVTAPFPGAVPATGADLAIALPAGSVLLDITASGDAALLRIAPVAGGPQSLLRVDLSTGTILARYRLDGLAPAPAARLAPATVGSGTPAPMLDLYKSP